MNKYRAKEVDTLFSGVEEQATTWGLKRNPRGDGKVKHLDPSCGHVGFLEALNPTLCFKFCLKQMILRKL